MGFLTGIGAVAELLKVPFQMFAGWLQHKQDLALVTRKAELEQTSMRIEDMKTSWKDEYLTLVWTLPIVLSTVGIVAPLNNLLSAFQAIPGWYQNLLLLITGASFGVNLYGQVQTIRRNGNGTAVRKPSNPEPEEPSEPSYDPVAEMRDRAG